ncbi:NAD-dependent protein deacylase [Sansalvadorimonas sp. 2012CJ34-2]|uniref:NAD-dependent protein deacylase n=1 Tax=Parendozoicomonas callyspongiae TaxID=2942213 RepID=A0ABT0PBD3_9GAMM|nr:NAD-dependent protein deacylase [Sansalvadorimonas sp. 2012CJ34-2]
MARCKSVVILTGAGISAESGIRTFRAADGLWEDHTIEDVATPEGFLRNPDLVHRFYNARRQQLGEVQPNAAHYALAEFEQKFTGEYLLVTQNVDDLHERAGSQKLIHMHGELLKARCKRCGSVSAWCGSMDGASRCPLCSAVGSLRPHIVWFHEMPLELDRIYNALSRCDLFISIGTSGNVYPAAGFFQEASAAGARTVELNLEPGQHASIFDHFENGPATSLVPAYLKTLL